MSVCPICFSHHTRRDGYGADGRQNYRCIDCNRTFRQHYQQRGRQPFVQEQIIRLHQKGGTIRGIAAKLKIGKNTVQRHLNAWRTKVAQWDLSDSCLY